MRERRSVIPNDYVLFLQENEDSNNDVMEDDPITAKPCKILIQKNGLSNE